MTISDLPRAAVTDCPDTVENSLPSLHLRRCNVMSSASEVCSGVLYGHFSKQLDLGWFPRVLWILPYSSATKCEPHFAQTLAQRPRETMEGTPHLPWVNRAIRLPLRGQIPRSAGFSLHVTSTTLSPEQPCHPLGTPTCHIRAKVRSIRFFYFLQTLLKRYLIEKIYKAFKSFISSSTQV